MRLFWRILIIIVCLVDAKILILHLEIPQTLMKKFTAISLATIVAASTFIGCNSNTYIPGENTASSVAVYSFSIQKNDSVLANLDTVFFSIDLNRGLIFNADSLPYGTRIDKLVPKVTTLENVSKVLITDRTAAGTDSVHDYLEHPGDTIDFSNGPVSLTIASPNGDLELTYKVKVNVHTLKSDSLVWANPGKATLPSAFNVPTRQHTVKAGDVTYVLTNVLNEYSIARRSSPYDEWTVEKTTLPEKALVNSFAATTEALYILSDRELYASTDGGKSWSATGAEFDYIYGVYGDRVIGSVNENREWFTCEYPGGLRQPLPEGMPVRGTSQLIYFSFPLSGSAIASFVGGLDAGDNFTGDTWGFDGKNWARISVRPLPVGVEEPILVPFFAFVENSVFVASEYSILLAFGGFNESGIERNVYVSSDYGRTWSLGGELVQLPEIMPYLYGAQAYVEYLTLGSRAGGDEWINYDFTPRIPASMTVDSPFNFMSRATKPVYEWECPYIYLYGGIDERGRLNQSIWRATLNRLTFKPIL